MARYKDAIDWIARNDDTEWLNERDSTGYSLSVTAMLVADLFDKEDDEVANDIQRAVKRIIKDR